MQVVRFFCVVLGIRNHKTVYKQTRGCSLCLLVPAAAAGGTGLGLFDAEELARDVETL